MVLPIIKWAGGKRQLLPELIKRLPLKFGKYYEPFFGGGALFFFLQPKQATLNDTNSQLINIYTQIKNSHTKIINILEKTQNGYNLLEDDTKQTKYYLSKRNEFNKCITENILTVESASLFIFLNKAGYNGLYRVNKKGLFNVPSAHRKTLKIFDTENILAVSQALQKRTVKCVDFEEACSDIEPSDFVFFDSPYYNAFDTYQSGGFSECDHIRLAKLFKKLSDKGVYCLETNSNCEFIKKLYKSFNIDIVPVKRMINCDSAKRTGNEVIITNFK